MQTTDANDRQDRPTVLLSYHADPGVWDALRSRFPEVRFVSVDTDGTVPPDGLGATALFRAAMPKEALSKAVVQAEELRWVHTSTAGFDWVLVPEVVERSLTVTRTARALSRPIAEFVLAMILMHLKQVPALLDSQRDRTWSQPAMRTLDGLTVGIIGAGAIGSQIAARCRAFGAAVIGTKRVPAPLPMFDEVLAPEHLLDVLSRSDIVVLACPLTRDTEHLIDAAAFRAMKRDAFLVNIARGAVVVEADLVDALQSGVIAGAALDVFETEPLPSEHPLWTTPRAIVTPHVAYRAPTNFEHAIEEFGDNLERFINGRALENELGSLALGY